MMVESYRQDPLPRRLGEGWYPNIIKRIYEVIYGVYQPYRCKVRFAIQRVIYPWFSDNSQHDYFSVIYTIA